MQLSAPYKQVLVFFFKLKSESCVVNMFFNH